MNSEDDQATTPEEVKDEAVPTSPEEGTEESTLDPWEQLEAEVAKWKETALRNAADLENFRKRAARERDDAMRYANQRLLEDLLPVIDNFEMGMLAASKESDSMIYVGMDMVRKQLAEFLASQGVEQVPDVGVPFDPNLHDAVQQEESTEQQDGHVLRVMRRGFRLRDRLLRPASVVVAKAPSQEGGES